MVSFVKNKGHGTVCLLLPPPPADKHFNTAVDTCQAQSQHQSIFTDHWALHPIKTLRESPFKTTHNETASSLLIVRTGCLNISYISRRQYGVVSLTRTVCSKLLKPNFDPCITMIVTVVQIPKPIYVVIKLVDQDWIWNSCFHLGRHCLAPKLFDID